jgi:Ca2+-binding RTX toxin-like protein
VTGGIGNDHVDLSASGAVETVSIAAAGAQAIFTRDVGAVVLTTGEVERLGFHASNGADHVLVDTLVGTAVTRVDIDLVEAKSASDIITVNGTSGADTVLIETAGKVSTVDGLSATVNVSNASNADELWVATAADNDIIMAANYSGAARLVIDAGTGDDTIFGSARADTAFGRQGTDRAFLGGGNDRFIWNLGDGNDTIDGQSGMDTLDFFASNVSEVVDISASGHDWLLFRNVAAIVQTTKSVETLSLHAFGGTDTITINDLSGTGLSKITIDLEATIGGGDGQQDTINLNGRAGADTVTIASSGNLITISGFPSTTRIGGSDTFDVIAVNGLAGDDTFDASGMGAGIASLSINSGDGNDVLKGGGSSDTFLFTTTLNAATNVDTIKKFSVAHDTLALDDAMFAGIGPTGTLADAAFHVGNAATDANQRIIYNSANGHLLFDSDGDGANAAVLFAKLASGLSLTSADILVI